MARLYRFLITFGMLVAISEPTRIYAVKDRFTSSKELEYQAAIENNQIEDDLEAERSDAESEATDQLPIPGRRIRRSKQTSTKPKITSPSQATTQATKQEILEIAKDEKCLVCLSEFNDEENGIACDLLKFKCCKKLIHRDCFTQCLEEYYKGKTKPFCPLCKYPFKK